MMIAGDKPASQLSTEELEELLARRRAKEEQHSLDVGRIGVVTSGMTGPVMQVKVAIEGFSVESVVDTGAQCTVISRSLLRQIAQHMHSQAWSIPQMRPPSLKLYGRGGKNCDELLITAEVLFQFSLDELVALFRHLEDGDLPEDFKVAQRLVLEKSNFQVVDRVLYYENPALPDYLRIVVPQCLRWTLLKNHNDKFPGHFTERKLHSTLRVSYWWSGMRSDVRQYCRSCLVCASGKRSGRKTHPKLQSIPISGPFHTVGVDVFQLPCTDQRNRYALTFMNYLTKWPEVFAIPDPKTETIAKILVEAIVVRRGVLKRLLSDRGAKFLSWLIAKS